MDETTTVVEDVTNNSIHNFFDKILEVMGFFRQIIDFLKGIFTPIISDALESVLG